MGHNEIVFFPRVAEHERFYTKRLNHLKCFRYKMTRLGTTFLETLNNNFRLDKRGLRGGFVPCQPR